MRPGWARSTTVLLAFGRPGMTVALAECCYYGTSKLLALLNGWGISYVEYDQTGPPPAADIVWVEAPANPVLTMPDWEALRAHPGVVVCDATVATPVYLRALDEGADIVLHSATKYLTGSHDALLGATVTRDPERSARLRDVPEDRRDRLGARRGRRPGPRPRHARRADGPPHRDGDRGGPAARGPPGRLDRALSRASAA